MNTDGVLKRMHDYVVGFVEKSYPAFGNLPVCPFAKKARIEGKIENIVLELNVASAMEQVRRWLESDKIALVLIHPDESMPLESFDEVSREMESAISGMGLSLFSAHPSMEYKEKGVYTRREPYPNWQLMRVSDLETAKKQLGKSRWYR